MTAKQAQNLLQYLDFYKGIPDGVWGPISQQACREFQDRFGGITVDGFVGSETEKALKHAVSIGYLDKDDEPTDPAKTGTFWDGVKYWTREEFRCQCGGKYCDGFPAEPAQTLVELLDDVRGHFGRPGHRSSGLRCKTWNALQSGVGNSYHMIGKAMDFCIEGHGAAEVRAYVATRPNCKYTYEIDSSYVHVEVY
jgi:peptidoglycan hydrolase-like protein with peptidoglycan-binding domain